MDDTPIPHGHGLAYALLAVFLAALAFGGWGLWTVFGPRPDDVRAQLSAQRDRIATLEQQATTLVRSDQVSREANRDLQRTLAEQLVLEASSMVESARDPEATEGVDAFLERRAPRFV